MSRRRKVRDDPPRPKGRGGRPLRDLGIDPTDAAVDAEELARQIARLARPVHAIGVDAGHARNP